MAGVPEGFGRRRFLSTMALVAVGASAGCGGFGAEQDARSPSRAQDVDTRVVVPVGFAAGSSILWASDLDLQKTLDVVAQAGATMLRFDIAWTFVEPYPDHLDWTVTDRVVNAAASRGLEILGTINNTPKWAAEGGQLHTGRPADPARYARYAREVAQHYAGRISRYEIWNEPNATMFFEPAPDAAVYTTMLVRAHDAIKNVDPRTLVIGGALGPAATATEGVVVAADFLRSMYANGAKGSFDALSFHPYDYLGTLADGTPYPRSPMQQIIEMHREMERHGDGDKKVWLTEYGAPTNVVSEDDQARLVVDSLQQWPESTLAGPFFVYTPRDENSSSLDPQHRFGVTTDAYVPKRAFKDLQRLVAEGIPERDVHKSFRANTDPALGPPLTPVFPISVGFGQLCERGTRFSTPRGFVSSPPAVSDIALQWRVLPSGDFGNGYQDMAVTGGARIYSTPATGTHVVAGGILAAWSSHLGLPLTDEYPKTDNPNPDARAIDFEHGTIVWSPSGGAQVIAK